MRGERGGRGERGERGEERGGGMGREEMRGEKWSSIKVMMRIQMLQSFGRPPID